MRSRSLLFVAALAAFVAGPVNSGAVPSPIVAHREGAATRGSHPAVNAGTPKAVIAARLGMPSQVLSPEVWVYREFHTDYRGADQLGCDTLLVIFADDRVRSMRLVNGATLEAALAAQYRAATTQLTVVAPPAHP